MKRKIILQGNKSFTLTLPIDWVRKFNLESGNEVDVEETTEGLAVKAETGKKKKEIVFAVPNGYIKNIKYLMKQLYRQGYDRIVLKYKQDKDFEIISKVVENDFIGLEIIDKKEKQCTIEVVVETNREKFDIFFRKLFQITKESFCLVKEKADITKFRQKFDAYQNFCKRFEATLKKGLIEYEYYSLLSYLLNIQADLHQLSDILLKKKIKVSKEGKNIFNKIIEFFTETEEAFFKKDFEKLTLLNKEIHEFIDKILNRLPKIDPKELFLAHYQMEILRLMYGMISPMVGIVIYKIQPT